MSKHTTEEIDESKTELMNFFRSSRKSDIWATVRTVSRSGMSRRIELFLIDTKRGKKPVLLNLSHHVGVVLGLNRNDNGLRVDGCGMDMIFEVIRRLEYAMGMFDVYSQTYRRF